jgi:hypothetical protein
MKQKLLTFLQSLYPAARKHSILTFTLGTFILTLGIGLLIIFKFHLLYPNSKVNLAGKDLDSTASSIFAECSKPELNKLECYKTQFYNIATHYGLLTTEEVLYSLQDKDELAKSCHVIGHNIGYGSYDRAPYEFNQLVEIANMNICGSGIMHGIIEHYVEEHPEKELNGNLAAEICNTFQDHQKKMSCIHLFGHLFLLYNLGDLTKALPMCESIEQNVRFNCYDGMFMEDHQKFMMAEHGIAPEPTYNEAYLKQMEKQCLSYTGDIAAGCWTEMAEMYDHVRGMKPKAVYDGCMHAQTQELAHYCYNKGVVSMGVRGDIFKTPESLLAICSFYLNNQSLYRGCLGTLISTNIYNSPKTTDRVVQACSLADSSYANFCFSLLGVRLKETLANKNMRTSFCSKLPEEYIAACLN